MGIPPDRTPGIRQEEAINLDDLSSAPTDPYNIALIDGDFVLIDSIGSYNPRSGGGISEAQHKALRQLIHFIDSGPAEDFASGAVEEYLPSGSLFPTSVIWWESSSKAQKIVERALTYSGVKVTQEVWTMYDTDGSTALATVTDVWTYRGIIALERERTLWEAA